jgi:hypothetical protein
MPIYQTTADLEKQYAVCAVLEVAWRCTIVRSRDPMDHVDAFAWRAGARIAAVEVKCWSGVLRKYGAYCHLDVAKAKALSLAAMEYGDCCAALYVMACDDGIFCVDVQDVIGVCPIATRGRTDRGNPVDVHPAYLVPLVLVRAVDPSALTCADQITERNMLIATWLERIERDGSMAALARVRQEIPW